MALYRNNGAGKFEDVTAGSGLDVTFYGIGTAVGDYDNDGNVDVFISAVGPGHLFRNAGGTFQDVTASAGVAGDAKAWGTSCGWLDYDNDGDLDLTVCNYLRWSKEIDLGLNCTLDGQTRAYCRPDAFEGAFPSLYRNEGGGRFTDVSAQAGLQVKNAATGVPVAKSLGLAPVDLDRDGWIDLVVANDTVQNFLFHNQRDGTFAEIGALAGVAFDSAGNARGAMGIDVAHFRNDDALGVAIANFANEMSALYVSSGGNLQFTDEAIATGLGPATRLQLKFGLFFFDYDLDGRLDLLEANGHLENEIHKIQESQHYEQPPHLFWNCGPEHSTEFLPVTAEQAGEQFFRPTVGRGASFADLDGDGDLDVLFTATGAAPRLLRNDQQLDQHWLRVKLIGHQTNRDAIGAWIEVETGGLVQRRQVMPTRSYLSQVELPVTFGLGKAGAVKKITVHWPVSGQQEIKNVAADHLITIHESPVKRNP